MNLTPDPPAPKAFESDPETQYRRLRVLVQATAVSVLILTGTVFVFIYRQVVLVRRQTAEWTRYTTEMEKAGMPAFLEQVRSELNDFRKQHPDFNAVYTRYFGTNEPAAPRPGVIDVPGRDSTNAPK